MSGRTWWRRFLDGVPDGIVMLACVLYALVLWYGFARVAAWIVANVPGLSVNVDGDGRLKAVILVLSLLMGLWVAVKTLFPPEDYDSTTASK
jgi:hypothetical protein